MIALLTLAATERPTRRVVFVLTAIVLTVSAAKADNHEAVRDDGSHELCLDRTPPPGAEEFGEGWYASIETDAGTILARLLPDQAPQAVAHFTALAEGRLEWIDAFTGLPRSDPYYDGIEIHKVLAGQRFEAGDRTATGRGAAPFYIPPEVGPINFYRGGRLGMTRGSLGRISGSLFFVTADAQPWLTNRHPCFGEVLGGLEVVRKISSAKANSQGKPLTPIVMSRVRIFRVGDPAPLPEPVPFTPEPQHLGAREDVRGR